jgi:fructose-specific phosphotransferase system IIC component
LSVRFNFFVKSQHIFFSFFLLGITADFSFKKPALGRQFFDRTLAFFSVSLCIKPGLLASLTFGVVATATRDAGFTFAMLT